MTNLAKQTAFAEIPGQTEINVLPIKEAKNAAIKKAKPKNKKSHLLTREDQAIVAELNKIRQDLDYLHNRYDQITDPLLVDSIIYELKAANIKYMYYLKQCKDKGIISG